MRVNLPFHSYRLRSRPASAARLLNCYAAANPSGAKTPARLMRTPGIEAWTTVGNGPIWLLHKALGYLWVVSGSELYRVSSNKTATLIGSIGAVSGRQSLDIASNTTSVVVVNNPNAFYYDGTTFGQITDTDFTSRGAGDVEFVDNFLLFREPDSGRFFGANVGTATAFDSLDFATAEASPDDLVGMKTDHRQVMLSGEETMELWENIGGAGFPFSRAINGHIEIGCLNGRTLQKCDNTLMWLASDSTVRRLNGVTPVRISHEGIEEFISTATTSQAYAWSYSQEGHLFYVLTFPEGTVVYDATSQEWHERGSYGYDYWLAGAHAQAYGLQLVGHSLTNKIGALKPTVYDEWGETLLMEWTYQTIYADGNRAFFDRLEIIVETGVGLTTGQGSDPQIMLSCSDDGGTTFEMIASRSMGAMGKRNTPVAWNQLGSSFQRAFRGSVSDPVPVTITDTQLEARGARPIARKAA